MTAKLRTLAETSLRFYRLTHERLLKVSEDLSGEQFKWGRASIRWRGSSGTARAGTIFSPPTSTATWIVIRKFSCGNAMRWPEGWSLPSGSIGRRDTGTEMADAEAELIDFPEQSEVVDYARRVFTFAEDAIAAIPDELLLEVAKDDPDGDTNLDNVIIYHEHLSRHLGMIEAIRGLQGLSGSASR